MILNFKIVDPFGDQGIPKEMFSLPSEVVAENGSAISVPITIKAPFNALEKTYLIELDVYWRMPDWNTSMKAQAMFLLSIWDQREEWPRPPHQLMIGLSSG